MKHLEFDDIKIYSSTYKYIDSNMYLLVENSCALVIDPHYNVEFDEILKINNVKNITIFLTHEHPDHISGLKWLNENYSTKIICEYHCDQMISNKRNTRPILITFVLEEKDKIDGTNLLEEFNRQYEPYICNSDITFEDEFEYNFNSHNFKFKRLLGHSKGSCCIIMDDKLIFTGDTLLKDYPVIVRFPGGNKEEYLNLTKPYFEKLNKELIVLPGHGSIFKLKEVINEGKLNVEFR